MITAHEEYQDLAKAIGLPESTRLFLKREDEHPLGSHKGRSIPVMIDKYLALGYRHFAISSSGNAALAAGRYVSSLNPSAGSPAESPIELDILIGMNIPSVKRARLEALKGENIRISAHERPLQALHVKTQDPKVKSLRQSTDDLALIGYSSLGEELSEIPGLKAIFIATSSGTTAEAIARYFIKKSAKATPQTTPEIHIVQTVSCHPISEAFNEDVVAGSAADVEDRSIADAIVDHTAVRKQKLVPLIEETGGSGWIAANDDIRTAMNMINKNTGLRVSANGALAMVGLMHAIYTGKKWDSTVALIIGGE